MCTTHSSQRAGFQEFTFLDSFRQLYSSYSSSNTFISTHVFSTPSAQPSLIQPNQLKDDTPTMTQDNLKWIHLLGKSTTLSSLALHHPAKLCEPNPFDGLTHTNSELPGLQGSIWGQETKVNYALSYLKGLALYCFNPHFWILLILYGFQTWTLHWGTETNLALSTPKEKLKLNLEQLHMHENHQAMKYFIKFSSLPHMSGGVTQHSVGKHTMVSPNILKLICFITANQHPHWPMWSCTSNWCPLLGMQSQDFPQNQ